MSPPPCLKYDKVKSNTAESGPDGHRQPGGLDTTSVTSLVVSVIAGLEAHRNAQTTSGTSGTSGPNSRADLSTPPPRQTTKRHRPSQSPSPCSLPPYTVKANLEYGLRGVLEMCGWEGDELDERQDKLTRAGITDFRLLNETDTPLAVLEKLGYNVMTSRLLYKNQGKYACKIIRERNALK